MKLTDIKPNPRNPRTISEEKLEKLKNSIIEMPKGLSIKPMIVDEDNIIIGGNQRYLALVELGYDEIPDNWVKKVIDLTEDEKKRFLIVDNVSFGEWDWGVIHEDFDLDALDYWGLDVVSFSPEVDYGILDYIDIADEVDDMKKAVKRGIMLDFDANSYNEAHELFKYYRSKKIDIANLVINFLKQEKEKYS
jgi:hypothetical protein